MGRNKDELIKLAEKITGQECKDVLTKKDALKKIACYYLGEEKEFASIADCLESIVEHGATGGGSGGGESAVLTSKKLTATDIRSAVEEEKAITPPSDVDGFSEITFPSYLLQEKVITTNGTIEFGTMSAPFFPKKVTVNIPSDYTIENLSLNKNSEPVTISYEGKAFVFLGTINGSGNLTGIGGAPSNLLNSNSVTISSAGSTAGTISSDPNAKTITYTPNASFSFGSVTITKVIIG